MEELNKENINEETTEVKDYDYGPYTGEVTDDNDGHSMSSLVIAGLAVAGAVGVGVLAKKKIGKFIEKQAVKSLQKKGYSIYEPEISDEEKSKEETENE